MTENPQAAYIRDALGMRGNAALYRVTPPVYDREGNTHEYVVVSSVIAPFTGAETLIFPANADGEVVSWGQIDGSSRGHMSHQRALNDAGYSTVEQSP